MVRCETIIFDAQKRMKGKWNGVEKQKFKTGCLVYDTFVNCGPDYSEK